MLRRYTKVTVLILTIIVLAIDGYFVYVFYQNPQNFPILGDGVRDVASAAADDAAVEEVSSRASITAVVHHATSANIVDNSTYIDHPLINNNPDAVLLATRVRDQDEGASDAHPIGVWYDANRGGKWAIFNQDLAAIPKGAIFNVTFSEGPGEAVFVHRAISANTVDNSTYIDHPLANNNLDAVLTVTPNWNPGGGTGIYNVHPVGVWYDDAEEKWAILNQDLAPMPKRAAFDVAVSDGTTPAK